ncbi:hypothetical protein [Poriferisphaera sp. WC338]|uniref:hypothetical protein n=1 Tax=Poriferisphaera sp. WC338 TaxID=3425129 RepID=UPI003D81B74A
MLKIVGCAMLAFVAMVLLGCSGSDVLLSEKVQVDRKKDFDLFYVEWSEFIGEYYEALPQEVHDRKPSSVAEAMNEDYLLWIQNYTQGLTQSGGGGSYMLHHGGDVYQATVLLAIYPLVEEGSMHGEGFLQLLKGGKEYQRIGGYFGLCAIYGNSQPMYFTYSESDELENVIAYWRWRMIVDACVKK